MSSLLSAVQVQPGKPPILPAEAVSGLSWDEYRDGLRAVVAEHGAVRVRGLGMNDITTVVNAFRGLATGGLMPEKQAFAERGKYDEGVYSSTKWPPNQQMCMHHELSYAMEFPTMMLFACLTAPSQGGTTYVSDSPTVLNSLPVDLVKRFETEGWILTRNYT